MIQISPMLPVDQPLSENDSSFAHEIKWDGYRVLAYLDERGVRLESRNGQSLNHLFPQVAKSASGKRFQGILDGEVVAFNSEGRVDFSLLRSGGNRAKQICYVVFDLLYYQGHNICLKPWSERRTLLETLVDSDGTMVLSPLLPGTVEDCLAFVKEQGLEGIVSKYKSSPYLPGTRSPLWRKQKIRRSLDCVLVGVRLRQNRVRSMAVGTYRPNGSLFFLGNVGSGLGDKELQFLEDALPLLAKTGSYPCPCVNPPSDGDDYVWCDPLVVVEIEFLELTPGKSLRHPVFLRFRFDKEPEDCVLEVCPDDN